MKVWNRRKMRNTRKERVELQRQQQMEDGIKIKDIKGGMRYRKWYNVGNGK